MASRSSRASRWSGSTRLRGVSKPDRGNEMATGRYARVAAVGSALPGRVVPNSYFESIVDTSDQWIQERTGIKERRFARSDESTGSLSAESATAALRRAGVGPESVDLLIIATCTPERSIPSTAAFVQARLGMTCPSFDLNAACAGFVYGLSVADAQIRAGAADRILLVGAELLTVPAGGSGEPITTETLAQRRNFLRMLDGQAVFKQAVTAMADACRQVLDKAGLSSDDVKMAIGHQANARILTALGKRLGLDPERVLIDIAHIGNTSAASIPIALDRAWSRGLLEPGDIVLTAAFGAGMAWGANVSTWTIPPPSPDERSREREDA